MKEKSWWIYQERGDRESWAIHLIARKERRSIWAETEIYADWFNNPSKRFLIGDMSIAQSRIWIETIGRVFAAYNHPLTDHDRNQIDCELEELKKSFLD